MIKKGNPTPTSHIYFSQRLRLHYLDWGNSEAPPLLLVHGHRDHCHNWDWVAAALRDEYHIVAPDFRETLSWSLLAVSCRVDTKILTSSIQYSCKSARRELRYPKYLTVDHER